MIKVSVLYPNEAGSSFDHDYYLERHMPLVAERLGDALKGYTVERGLAGGAPGEPPAYIAAGHLTFDSVEDFQTSFAPHTDEIMGDIVNYTDTTPIVLVSEIRR